MAKKSSKLSRYEQILTEVFNRRRKGRSYKVPFEREDLNVVADDLRVDRVKNLGDLIYTYRFRKDLPDAIAKTAPAGKSWVIRLAGVAKYRFALTALAQIKPNEQLRTIKIPDATPGIIDRYSFTDEQALLAQVRYNRLLDIFTGVACYSLQSHLRTQVAEIGQCEIDEIYVGVDESGTHFVLPVQAKGGSDRLGAVQIEQDMAVCAAKFPNLVCRPIGTQFLEDSVALFEFVEDGTDIRVAREAHYELVAPADISDDELRRYRQLSGHR